MALHEEIYSDAYSFIYRIDSLNDIGKLECDVNNGNRYPPYPSVKTKALPFPQTPTPTNPNPNRLTNGQTNNNTYTRR